MATHDERLALAREVAAAVLDRWGAAHVLAVGVHGSVARGDDHTGSDIDMAVITAAPEPAIPDRVRRVRGVIVDLGAITADGYLQLAREIGPNWPVASEQYVATLPLYDPARFFDLLRETHVHAVASAPPSAFADAASITLLQAQDSLASLQRHAARAEEAAARIALQRASAAVALTLGLLCRRTASNIEQLAHEVARGRLAMPEVAGPFAAALAAVDVREAAERMTDAVRALSDLSRERGVHWEAEAPAALVR